MLGDEANIESIYAVKASERWRRKGILSPQISGDFSSPENVKSKVSVFKSRNPTVKDVSQQVELNFKNGISAFKA